MAESRPTLGSCACSSIVQPSVSLRTKRSSAPCFHAPLQLPRSAQACPVARRGGRKRERGSAATRQLSPAAEAREVCLPTSLRTPLNEAGAARYAAAAVAAARRGAYGAHPRTSAGSPCSTGLLTMAPATKERAPCHVAW